MRNRMVRMILLVLAGGLFLFSAVMLFRDLGEIRVGEKHDEELTRMVVIPVTQETEGETQGEPVKDEVISQEEDDTIKVIAPIQVDFEALSGENPDVIGWLYCEDTPINYPVVQAEDNDHYLYRLLDGRSNAKGTLFMDYRNEADFSQWNSVIYGHNMKNGSMFGTLTKYKKQSYYDAHPQMYLLTPERDYLISIIAGFVARADDEIFNAFCPNEEEKEGLLNSWLDASTFTSEYEPGPEDRFITLSTCTYEFNNARYVLVGIIE